MCVERPCWRSPHVRPSACALSLFFASRRSKDVGAVNCQHPFDLQPAGHAKNQCGPANTQDPCSTHCPSSVVVGQLSTARHTSTLQSNLENATGPPFLTLKLQIAINRMCSPFPSREVSTFRHDFTHHFEVLGRARLPTTRLNHLNFCAPDNRICPIVCCFRCRSRGPMEVR